MASPIDRSVVARILRLALVLSVLVYPLVASIVLGPPKWREPWIPADQGQAILLAVLGIMALVDFAAGWLVGSLRQPPRFMAATADPAAFGFVRFLIGLALIESGVIFGLALSFITRDPRYVIALAVPAVLLMLQVPGVEQPRAGDGQWKT
jgi:hypothetical protein